MVAGIPRGSLPQPAVFAAFGAGLNWGALLAVPGASATGT
jgi:hypothetical protein